MMATTNNARQEKHRPHKRHSEFQSFTDRAKAVGDLDEDISSRYRAFQEMKEFQARAAYAILYGRLF